MFLDPIRWFRRRQRLVEEGQQEAHFLRRRHGAGALQAAREQLNDPDLSDWGRQVLRRAIKELAERPSADPPMAVVSPIGEAGFERADRVAPAPAPDPQALNIWAGEARDEPIAFHLDLPARAPELQAQGAQQDAPPQTDLGEADEAGHAQEVGDAEQADEPAEDDESAEDAEADDLPDPLAAPDATAGRLAELRERARAEALGGEHRIPLASAAGPGSLVEALNLLVEERRVEAEFVDDGAEPYIIYRPRG